MDPIFFNLLPPGLKLLADQFLRLSPSRASQWMAGHKPRRRGRRSSLVLMGRAPDPTGSQQKAIDRRIRRQQEAARQLQRRSAGKLFEFSSFEEVNKKRKRRQQWKEAGRVVGELSLSWLPSSSLRSR